MKAGGVEYPPGKERRVPGTEHRGPKSRGANPGYAGLRPPGPHLDPAQVRPRGVPSGGNSKRPLPSGRDQAWCVLCLDQGVHGSREGASHPGHRSRCHAPRDRTSAEGEPRPNVDTVVLREPLSLAVGLPFFMAIWVITQGSPHTRDRSTTLFLATATSAIIAVGIPFASYRLDLIPDKLAIWVATWVMAGVPWVLAAVWIVMRRRRRCIPTSEDS